MSGEQEARIGFHLTAAQKALLAAVSEGKRLSFRPTRNGMHALRPATTQPKEQR